MKKAIIIGATSGIGRELAKLLMENGYKVGITGRRGELLDEIKKENPNAYSVKLLDVTDTKNAIEKLDELVSELGGMDVLILSSGIGDMNENLDFTIEKRTIDTNVIGFTCVADWAFNYFEKQNYGHLVGISSVGGLRGSRQAPAYNATKAYQINYLEGLRQKATNLKMPIFVTDIRPGLVDTAMAKGEGLFWVMPLNRVTQQIFRAIKRQKKVAYVTKRWRIIAFISKHLPKFIYDKM
ncbi:MAG: SDR family NAD(P)-dependent oxidoreductase [Paludibacteraceae bacterium]|jgi:short-subunit dehydrogenase|nr:SDR family NAD(P)-dependent oxidoreductase [Paludibacteraceae bacterium]OQC34264.1 MAG: putative oxidoreductase [Bacteroidetes bacterium ADurb.Bin057]HHT61590.1 SDR family NAD(P)-dependent oxidoreductase [Bacteroidales bacterium]MBP9039379.1 SDR family NAD(P)-dependent oxidoreductase [Paludibacteraceae bacterium]HOH70806.1 SDR family NAD(P)-dependent oxidoreductase [Paludibacteraceae bacterium]